MSLTLAGGVALAYAAGVVGIHRAIVARRRAFAGHYPELVKLDFDTLLHGVSAPPQLATALRTGAPLEPGAIERAPLSDGEARWLELLATFRSEPDRVLDALFAAPPETVAQLYLREWLVLEHRVNPLNLEFASFSAKLRINRGLRRFGEHHALYFIRARASSLLGFNAQVVDDLARAVYFSRNAPFYLDAVARSPFIEEVRPALTRACRDAQNIGAGGADTSS